jgi:hypothetical protein
MLRVHQRPRQRRKASKECFDLPIALIKPRVQLFSYSTTFLNYQPYPIVHYHLLTESRKHMSYKRYTYIDLMNPLVTNRDCFDSCCFWSNPDIASRLIIWSSSIASYVMFSVYKVFIPVLHRPLSWQSR